jgi:Divergent InlB B-repeat domain
VGVYDYASHMHYTPFEFSANNLPVMQTVPAGIPLDSYSVLSPGDLDTLFRMYAQAPAFPTLVTNPPGLQMTIDGQAVGSPQTLNWTAGSTHTVSAAGQTSGNPRYVFARWSDGGNVTHTITADPAATFYSLDFIQQAPLSVGVAASGGGTASLDVATPDGYAPGQTVFTMTASPAPGYTFQHWSGGTSCPRANAGSQTTFVPGSTAISCVATFTKSPVTTIVTDPLNLPVVVDGASFVQTPVNEVWAAGTTHTISTLAPASNPTSPVRYVFEGWSDGGAASHTVTAGSGGATIRAGYKTQYNLVLPSFSPAVATITVSPSSPDGFCDAGTKLQVMATPGPGFKFFQWTRDLAGQPSPATLTMDSQKLFGASFFQNPSALAIANSASLANTALAPGEIVTIFRSPAGTNPIGPDSFVVAQPDASGKFGTSLADTMVTFNGVPAPIVYASAGQTIQRQDNLGLGHDGCERTWFLHGRDERDRTGAGGEPGWNAELGGEPGAARVNCDILWDGGGSAFTSECRWRDYRPSAASSDTAGFGKDRRQAGAVTVCGARALRSVRSNAGKCDGAARCTFRGRLGVSGDWPEQQPHGRECRGSAGDESAAHCSGSRKPCRKWTRSISAF